MSTQEQTNANRTNAQSSTGPKTDEGKATSSQNAVKHGFFARNDVISGEDPAAYEQHRADIYAEYAPLTTTESVLTQRIASLAWRLMRADRLQTTTINTLVAAQQRATQPKAPPELNIDAMVAELRRKDKDPEYALNTAGIILAGLVRYDREPVTTDPAVDKAISDAMDSRTGAHICDAEIQLGTVIYNDFNGPAVLDRLLGYEQRMQSLLFKTICQIQQIQERRIKLQAARDKRDWQQIREEGEERKRRREEEHQQRIHDACCAEEEHRRKSNTSTGTACRAPNAQNEANSHLTSESETTYNRSRYAKAKRDKLNQPPSGPKNH